MKIDIRMTTLKSRLMLPFNKLTFPVSSLHINEKISVPWWQTTAEETWNFMTTFWDSESGQHQERGKEYSDCFLTRRLHCSCTEEGCYDWTVELTRSFFFCPSTIKAWSHWKRRPFSLTISSHCRLEVFFTYVYIKHANVNI